MKTLWILRALALAFYGLALLFITDTFLSLYGVTINAGPAWCCASSAA